MPVKFPSEEWVKAYENAVNQSANYKLAGKDWTHGALGFVVTAEPSIGLDRETAFVLDVHQGVCRKAFMCEPEEARKQPFCITGNYAQWKAVMRKELDPVKGMMQGKLKLKGNLPVIVRFVKAAQELVEATTTIDTQFLTD
jgi:putative sterol carrier protein